MGKFAHFNRITFRELIEQTVAWEDEATKKLPEYINAHNAMLDELEVELPGAKFGHERWATNIGGYSFKGFEADSIVWGYWASGWSEDQSCFMPAGFMWAPLATIDAEKQKLRNQYLAEQAEKENRKREHAERAAEHDKERLRELIEQYPDLAADHIRGKKVAT